MELVATYRVFSGLEGSARGGGLWFYLGRCVGSLVKDGCLCIDVGTPLLL